MPHPLEQRIADLRRQARRLLTLYGASWVVGSVVATTLAIGLADYLIHFQDRGIRTIASLAVAGVLVWTAYRYLYLSLARRLRDVEVAQRVERRFPELQDRLSSTIDFLKQSEEDARAGSALLRRAVIVETASAVEGLDLSSVLERRPVRRAACGAAAVLLVALAVVVLAPFNARVALARLVKPFGNDAWPQINKLGFLKTPTRLALGQPFEVELVDEHQRLPDEVRIHYRYAQDRQEVEEVETMHLVNGAMVARKDNVTRPFQYRAEGGDDRSMDWIDLEVVEPPRVESLRLKLYPPAYTGWPTTTADRDIHALRGSRVEVSGASTKKLTAAALVAEGAPPIPARLSADGTRFSIAADAAEPFVIDKSGGYWFELTDDTGMVGGATDRWEIRAVTDQPPTVVMEHPAGNTFVAAEAVVPLRILAKDDLALRDVVLHYNRSDHTDVEDFAVPLWSGPERVETAASGAALAGELPGESQLVEYPWELAPLGLKPGTTLNFNAVASDYVPQTGPSPVRRLTVITPRELEERIAERQALILGELRRVLKLQQETRTQTTGLEIQLKEVGRLNKQDVDHAQGAELNQRQIARTLTGQTEGIPPQINELLLELETNKLDRPDLDRRMRGILAELDRLGKEDLSVIERELTTTIKRAQAGLPDEGHPDKPEKADKPDAALKESLTTVGEHQDLVVQSLEKLLSNLTEWDSYRRFGREVAQIQHDQEEIENQTNQLGQKTLGKDPKDLDSQQQADLKKLASRQGELARRFDKVQQQMDQIGEQLKESDPLAAGTIADALHHARRQDISGQMRQSSAQVEQNQVSQASGRQQQVGRDLNDLLDILSNRRQNELARLIKKLREAQNELAEVRRQQDGLRKKLKAAEKEEDGEAKRRELERLTKEERNLEEESRRLARQLERLQAEQAGRSASSAAAKMSQAGQAGQQGDAKQAGEKSDKALEDLDKAQEQLAERIRQAEADLAQEQLARIEDSLKALRQRQQQVNDETDRLDQTQAAKGQLSRAQSTSLRNLARQQKSVEGEAKSLAEKIQAAKVFHLALEAADKLMAQAADLLQRGETGAPTQRAEADALAQLDRLLEAMKFNSKPQPQSQGGGSGGNKQGQPLVDAIRRVAELKLLKVMQEDLNERFKSLSAAPPDEAAADRAAQISDIAQQQGQLAELALDLNPPATADAPEDEPQDDEMPADAQPGDNPDNPADDDPAPATSDKASVEQPPAAESLEKSLEPTKE